MSTHFDVIVIGVGGMGSATVYQLAKQGYRVLGLERFDIPHSMGSSHGVTRIIRMAYAEHPAYIPLLRRAYELWRETETAFGEQLLYVTGGLDISADEDGAHFQRAKFSCDEYDLPYEVLEANALMSRFPAVNVPAGYKAVHQPDAGFVMSERAIVAHVTLAQQHGATVQAREAVQKWWADGDGVRVETDKETYSADKLVVSAGAWASQLLAGMRIAPNLMVPERQVLAWLQPQKPELFAMGALPVWIMDVPEGVFYGFPVHGVPGFKFGRMHHREQDINPDTMNREPDAEDEALLRDFATKYFPQGSGATMALKTCIFTNTPDEHFIVDVHPQFPQVVFGAGYSGHGYKFASVMGEVLADLALTGTSKLELDWLKLSRFG
ncbi:MAG: N-methyl-L-tryptophan oxidase [Aggregatilineales bacterium]